MIQTTLNLSLNYKIHFDDIKSLSFCEEVRNKSNDFLSSDNHCLIFLAVFGLSTQIGDKTDRILAG